MARLERGWKNEPWMRKVTEKRPGKDSKRNFLFLPSLMVASALLFALTEYKNFERMSISYSSFIPP